MTQAALAAVKLGIRGPDPNTLLLMHYDGADGGTTFVDNSENAWTFSANGNAQTDTSQSMFGGSSLLLDGTGDFLTGTDDPIWTFTGDFTIECFVRFNSVAGAQVFVAQWGVSSTSWIFQLSSSTLNLALSTNGTTANLLNLAPAWTPSTGVWYHLAAVRSGSTCTVYVDGVSLGSGSGAGTLFNATFVPRVGSQGSGNTLNGWIDEVRISTVARYTANFTRPAQPFS